MAILRVVERRSSVPPREAQGMTKYRSLDNHTGEDRGHLGCCGEEFTSFSSDCPLAMDTIMYLLTRVRNYYKAPLTHDTGGVISGWKTPDGIALRVGETMVDISSDDGGIIRQNIEDALDTLE